MVTVAKKPPKRTSFTVTVQVSNLRETLAAVRAVGKDAEAALRVRAAELAKTLAASITSAAKRDKSPQARLVVQTLKVKRDRLPVLEVGGTKRLGRNKAPAWALLFGAEFGSNGHKQFHKRHTGTTGSWFFPTVERDKAEIVGAWEEAAADVVREFGEG